MNYETARSVQDDTRHKLPEANRAW